MNTIYTCCRSAKEATAQTHDWDCPINPQNARPFEPNHAAELAALRAELEDARKDAERYRWLRDSKPTTWEVRYWGKGFWHCATDTSGSNLDAAIDAATHSEG